MATTTLTHNPQKITVPDNTDEHEINYDAVLNAIHGEALIERVSGTAVQLNCNGVAISSVSPSLTETNNKFILPLKREVKLKYKGGAGSEEFIITVFSKKGVD